jgi:hypothetical protein
MAGKVVSLVSPTDGKKVEFVDGDPECGSVKRVYFSPDRSYVVAFYMDPLDPVGRERLERLVGVYRNGIFGREGGDYYRGLYRWPERLVEHGGRTGIVAPVYEPKFYFPAGSGLEGAEKQGKWFASAKNFNRAVPPDQRGDLAGYLAVCASLSRAVLRLHASGLAHSDLSYKNCLVDPLTGSACVIDIDGLVVPGLFPPDVAGTPDFIAPEVVATLKLPKGDPAKNLPCIATDEHALAVLVYLYLFRRHPLRGAKVWDLDQDVQESLEMGERALFVEHPSDGSNRPPFDPKSDAALLPWADVSRLPYTAAGPHLARLFRRAFVDALHDPPNRPSADDWEVAVTRTQDLLVPCAGAGCPMGWHAVSWTAAPPVLAPRCPYCGAPYALGSLPYLDFYSRMPDGRFARDMQGMSVFHGRRLYPWHTNRNVFQSPWLPPDEAGPVGFFLFRDGLWSLANTGAADMESRDPTGGPATPVRPGTAVALRDGQEIVFSAGAGARKALVSLAGFS